MLHPCYGTPEHTGIVFESRASGWERYVQVLSVTLSFTGIKDSRNALSALSAVRVLLSPLACALSAALLDAFNMLARALSTAAGASRRAMSTAAGVSWRFGVAINREHVAEP
jgi:hypothetical protein